jgi:hypothetical protein
MKTRRHAKTLLSPRSSRPPIIASHRGFPAPSHQYRVIYADPPWTFQNRSDKGTGRNATSHYDCLDYHQFASPSVADLAAKHCALFLGPSISSSTAPWTSSAHGALLTKPSASIG